MNRVWEIREHRKDSGAESYGGNRGKGMSGMKGRMSGYKDKKSFDEGFEEGYCAVLDALDAFLEEHMSE